MSDDYIITPDGSGFDGVTYTTYTVKTGDTLEKIATEHGISVAILIQVNGLEIGQEGHSPIAVGQPLQIPVLDTNTGTAATSGGASNYRPQTIKTKSTRGVKVGHPFAQVSIATETGMLTLNQNLAVSSNNFDGDILSYATNRDIGQDCPTFNLRVVYRHDWYSVIGSNDLIIISLCRPPEKKAVVMVGLVDDIRRSTDFSTGKPIRSFDITGRGFNKALVNFAVGAIAELGGIEESSKLGFMGNMTDIFSGHSPAYIVDGVLAHYLTKGCNYQFANGTSFLSYYQQFISDNPNVSEQLENSMSFLNYQGSLWQLLKEVKNAPFNEMFWEIYDDKPTFIFRPTPFDSGPWNGLERIQIKDIDIVSENVGRSDLETYVLYSVKATSFIGNVDIDGNWPLWYQPYYSKYGLTRLQIYSKFIGTSEEGSDAVILKKQHDIFNWNIKNNSMENGTITVKGSNLFKVGTRVILESTGIEYYVEKVAHNFTLFESWTTTLSVTRGIKPDNRFTAPWGCGVQMLPTDASEIYGYDVTAYPMGGTGVYPGTDTGGLGYGDGTTATLTGKPNQDIVAVALAEVGVSESDDGHLKYIKAYDSSWGRGTDWCACFVNWCARQAGVPTDCVPKFASVPTGFQWFKNNSHMQKSKAYGGTHTPQPGDIIFFDWDKNPDDGDHTGIVVSCSGTTITTVEGNCGDAVKKQTHSVSSPEIIGFGTYKAPEIQLPSVSGGLNIVQQYATKNACYISNGKLNVKGLVLHSVGCSQPSAKAFANSWNAYTPGGNKVCVHGFIDANEAGLVYQLLPWTMTGWHAGGSANSTHIGVEMCEPACIKYTSGANFTCTEANKPTARACATRAYNTAVLLYASLCKQFSLNPLGDGVIISHKEGCARGVASNHGDPEHLWSQLGMSYTMDTFRRDVKLAMDKGSSATPTQPTQSNPAGLTLIMGTNRATASQMIKYIKSVNSNVPQKVIDMIPLYLSEGAAEGVRGDIAFAQSCLETGNFGFAGSAVTLDQNNFAGIGVTSNGMKGNSFSTPQIGIRAQIQHLKAYGSTSPLANACVDPRFNYVTRNSAPYWEWLGIPENPNHVGWAGGKDYGKLILQIWNKILAK